MSPGSSHSDVGRVSPRRAAAHSGFSISDMPLCTNGSSSPHCQPGPPWYRSTCTHPAAWTKPRKLALGRCLSFTLRIEFLSKYDQFYLKTRMNPTTCHPTTRAHPTHNSWHLPRLFLDQWSPKWRGQKTIEPFAYIYSFPSFCLFSNVYRVHFLITKIEHVCNS